MVMNAGFHHGKLREQIRFLIGISTVGVEICTQGIYKWCNVNNKFHFR
jgi:hypothetical protein